METYHKIMTLFKRDMDGSLTGKKGTMLRDQWSTPELEYLARNEWEFTEKVDGTNIRIFLRLVEDSLYVDFAGRTDNAVLPKPLLARLETLFPAHPTKAMPNERERLVIAWMVEHGLNSVQLFGEGYGPKIQNGGNYGTEQDFVLFDVKVGDFWLDRAAVDNVAASLEISSVPVIGYGTLYDAIAKVESGIRPIRISEDYVIPQNLGDGLKSTWGDFEAEGIVARPCVPLFNRKGERIICKIKGVDFK